MAREQRHDDANAFIPEDGSSLESRDDLAELLAEDFLQSATSGESVDADVRDQVLPEEMGGPFVETNAEIEFGSTVDEDDEEDEEDEEKEAFPQAVAPLILRPRRN